MNAADVRKELAKAIEEAGSMRKWAAAHDLSPQHVSDVMLGIRRPGPSILKHLGLTRVDFEPEYRRVRA